MGFKNMARADMKTIYTSLGDTALFTHNGVVKEIFVIEEPSFNVEYVEYQKYRAIKSEVVEIAVGDSLEIDGVERVISNFNPSDDGLEMYIGLDDD